MLAASGMALVMAASGALGSPAIAGQRIGANGSLGWLQLERQLGGFLPVGPLLSAWAGPNAIDTGSDGRLTILLLGSDTRGSAVQRTDTIMIMSIKNGVISAASIPRDTARIANPDGGTFSDRINAILKLLKVGRTLDEALAKFEIVIEKLLQIEIDYYALIKFDGFNALVDEVDPITVSLPTAITDTRFWDNPNLPSGVYFPAASSYNLYAWQPNANPPLCNGLWKSKSTPIAPQYWCQRALPFVRSRKGTGNSDFVRARRQQNFVVAAITRVVNRGSGAALSSLLGEAGDQVSGDQLVTDIPLTFADALELYNRLAGASVGLQVVFKPQDYATHIPGTTAYQLILPAVRQTTAQWFK